MAVLIIDDDQSIRDLVSFHLADIGLEVECAADGEAGLELALSRRYDLVILDVRMPRMNGLDVCRELRKERPYLPIIMLTSQGEVVDRVVGLELGADDYVVKPFGAAEFKARVRARLRAQGRFEQPPTESSEPLAFGNLLVDPAKRTAAVDGVKIRLTAKEFDLLLFLARSPGRAFTREQLLESVWGLHTQSYAENISSFILRLRKKIERDSTEPFFIRTVHGVGYRFADLSELRATSKADGG